MALVSVDWPRGCIRGLRIVFRLLAENRWGSVAFVRESG